MDDPLIGLLWSLVASHALLVSFVIAYLQHIWVVKPDLVHFELFLFDAARPD